MLWGRDRARDVDRSLLVALAAFLLIAAQTTMKAVRDGVFLAHFGLLGLSYAMFGMAVCAGGLSSVYHRLTGIIGRRRAALWMQLFVAASMVAIGEGLHRHVRGMPIVLYVYAGTVGLIAIAELWLLADNLSAGSDAARRLTLVGTGAIGGGIAGGVLTRLLATHISAREMLWIVAAELVMAATLMHVAPARRRQLATHPPHRFGDGLRVLRGSAHVRAFALAMLCLTVAITTMEWQLKGLVRWHFALAHDGHTQEQALVAFFGELGAVVSCMALLLQLIGTERLLSRFGVLRCLRVLPSWLALVGVVVLGVATFPLGALVACGVGAAGSETLRLSLDKSSTELLYLPLDPITRSAAKRVIDTVVDRVGGGLTALLWLVMVMSCRVDLPDRIGYASVATLVAVVIWLFALARLRKTHRDTLSRHNGALSHTSTPEQRPEAADVLIDHDELRRAHEASHQSPEE